jgi:hypothetical protein
MAKKRPRPKRPARSRAALPEMRCFLPCEFVSTDPGTSKTSLYGVFDTINFDEFPALFKPFSLFVKLVGANGKHTIAMTGIGTNGKPFDMNVSVDIDLTKSPGADITVAVNSVVFTRPGIVQFVLKCDGHPIGWPCEIRVATRKARKA